MCALSDDLKTVEADLDQLPAERMREPPTDMSSLWFGHDHRQTNNGECSSV